MSFCSFPRNTYLLALAYVPKMEKWTRKDADQEQEQESSTTADNIFNNNNENEDDFFFGGGDLVEAVTRGATYAPAHFLPLTCIREIFNVVTPMVAMDEMKRFDPLQEEHLSVFKQTETLHFTLTLSLKFHGDEERKATPKMLEMLSSIRFLKGLRLCGRFSCDDFVQLGKMAFLQTLELFEPTSLTDDYFLQLASSSQNKTSIKSLIIKYSRRITKKGLAVIPVFAPQLESITLIDCEKLTPDCLDAWVTDHPEFLKKNIKKFHAEPIFITPHVIENVICKMENLQELHLERFHQIRDEQIIQIAKHCSRLQKLTVHYCCEFKPNLMRYLAKYLGDTLTHINLFFFPQCRFDSEVRDREIPLHVYPPDAYAAFCFGDQLVSFIVSNCTTEYIPKFRELYCTGIYTGDRFRKWKQYVRDLDNAMVLRTFNNVAKEVKLSKYWDVEMIMDLDRDDD